MKFSSQLNSSAMPTTLGVGLHSVPTLVDILCATALKAISWTPVDLAVLVCLLPSPPAYWYSSFFADADECYGGSGPCLHYCTNLPGTFACSCREGYAPGSDPTSCKGPACHMLKPNCFLKPFPTDIDECKRALDVGERLCYESEACINVEGSFDCVCAPGLLFIYNTIDSSFCGSE